MMDQNEQAGDAQRTTDPFSLPRLTLIAVPVVFALLVAYWFLLRTSYEPILTAVEPDQAAEIVKVLEDRKVDYRLSDEGRTILVASGEASKARLELVGSELPVRGQVGFELFNQSDMGLTEFAQKINYQRALQGELARTILLLKGIKSVRVHLGMPERSLFRDEQSRPKASITLILEPGASLTESRVNGIQRMVAGAIPELTPDAVAVLDGTGKVVSRDGVAEPERGSSDAIIADYQARIGTAIDSALPSLRARVNVSLRMRAPAGEAAAKSAASDAPTPRGEPDFAINLRITTAAPVDDPARAEIVRIARETASLDPARGDSIVFLTGDPVPPPAWTAPVAPAADRVVAATALPPAERSGGFPPAGWLLAAGLILLSGVTVLAIRRYRPAARPDEAEVLGNFTDQLRRRLAMEQPA